MRVQYVPGTLWEPGNEARSNPFLTPFYAPEEYHSSVRPSDNNIVTTETKFKTDRVNTAWGSSNFYKQYYTQTSTMRVWTTLIVEVEVWAMDHSDYITRIGDS